MKVGKVYSLVWDHFTSNISTFVKDNLLENNGLSDVTLVSDDNNKFHAHKTVLSAGSQIFNDIFELNNTTNNGEPQTIIVGGVRGAELDHLLRFLYTGEVLLQKDAAITFTENSCKMKTTLTIIFLTQIQVLIYDTRIMKAISKNMILKILICNKTQSLT